jgi:hypothetical protein
MRFEFLTAQGQSKQPVNEFVSVGPVAASLKCLITRFLLSWDSDFWRFAPELLVIRIGRTRGGLSPRPEANSLREDRTSPGALKQFS